jgi:general secretion pathway protein G
VKPSIGLTFAAAMRAFVHQDPDVIMVDEVGDTETVNISIHAALAGHVVLTTLAHRNGGGGAAPARSWGRGFDFGLNQSKIINVIDSKSVERDAGGKRGSAFPHPALAVDEPKGGASHRGSQDGFTLIEILVVITIIGLIMGLVGPRVLTYLSEAKVKAATIQIQSFASSLDLFYLDLGRYPTSSEGLSALVQRPGGSPGERSPFEIISLGSDGQEGGTDTAADIKSWELNK